jgi:hypothetical protein
VTLTRDPADWARQWGWMSPLRAARAAARLRTLAEGIVADLGDAEMDKLTRTLGLPWREWVAELESLAEYVEPKNRWRRKKVRS